MILEVAIQMYESGESDESDESKVYTQKRNAMRKSNESLRTRFFIKRLLHSISHFASFASVSFHDSACACASP